MKKLLMLSIALTVAVSAYAQEKKEVKVSGKVKSVLVKLYPDAKDVKWSEEFDVDKASFVQGGKQIVLIFRADTLYMHMVQTEISELPQTVVNHLDKYYKDFKIVRAGKIYSSAEPNDKNVCYGADITDGTITKRVICYPNGSEMSASTIPAKK